GVEHLVGFLHEVAAQALVGLGDLPSPERPQPVHDVGGLTQSVTEFGLLAHAFTEYCWARSTIPCGLPSSASRKSAMYCSSATSRTRSDPTPPVRGIGSCTTPLVGRYCAPGNRRLSRICFESGSSIGEILIWVPATATSSRPYSRHSNRRRPTETRRSTSSGSGPYRS